MNRAILMFECNRMTIKVDVVSIWMICAGSDGIVSSQRRAASWFKVLCILMCCPLTVRANSPSSSLPIWCISYRVLRDWDTYISVWYSIDSSAQTLHILECRLLLDIHSIIEQTIHRNVQKVQHGLRWKVVASDSLRHWGHYTPPPIPIGIWLDSNGLESLIEWGGNSD